MTLVSCIVPPAFGIYWKRANVPGAMLAVVLGLGSWLAMETLSPEAAVPPQLVGLGCSVFGMLFGSIAMGPKPHGTHARASAAAGHDGHRGAHH